MPEIDASEFRAALARIRRDEPARRANRESASASASAGLRVDIGSRRGGIDSGVSPQAPTIVVLDKPFLIWADSYGAPSNILVDSHVEPHNSSARVYFSKLFEGTFFDSQAVGFYFFWQNDSAADSVVNASASFSLKGEITVNPRDGWIPKIWWGTGTVGWINGSVTAELTPLEWWNQPPTQPSVQGDQYQVIREISVRGDWTPLANPGAGTAYQISESYHLHHSMFRIPPGASAVFEVRLRFNYEGNKSSLHIDFSNDDRIIICPHVELEVLTTPRLDVSPDIRPSRL